MITRTVGPCCFDFMTACIDLDVFCILCRAKCLTIRRRGLQVTQNDATPGCDRWSLELKLPCPPLQTWPSGAMHISGLQFWILRLLVKVIYTALRFGAALNT